jgi:hypothetical protein
MSCFWVYAKQLIQWNKLYIIISFSMLFMIKQVIKLQFLSIKIYELTQKFIYLQKLFS